MCLRSKNEFVYHNNADLYSEPPTKIKTSIILTKNINFDLTMWTCHPESYTV